MFTGQRGAFVAILFMIYQLYRESGACVFSSFAAVVRGKASLKVSGPSGVQCAVGAFEYIYVMMFLIGMLLCHAGIISFIPDKIKYHLTEYTEKQDHMKSE